MFDFSSNLRSFNLRNLNLRIFDLIVFTACISATTLPELLTQFSCACRLQYLSVESSGALCVLSNDRATMLVRSRRTKLQLFRVLK
jgi:hypothetical protein